MKRSALPIMSLLTLAALLTVLSGCDEKKPAGQPAAPAAKAPASPAPSPAVQVEVPPEPKFVYQVEGRRDPFIPLLALAGKNENIEFANPLEAYDLVQYQIKGVIIGFGEPRAMVVAPDGKSYILKKGLRIGKSNGVILEINREKILVEESYQDLTGMTHKNLQEIKVPKREGV